MEAGHYNEQLGPQASVRPGPSHSHLGAQALCPLGESRGVCLGLSQILCFVINRKVNSISLLFSI